MVGGLAMGVMVALACASSSEAWVGSPPVAAAPGPASMAADAGTTTNFVTNAQRGLVVPPDLSDVERMCALLTSCDKLPIPPSLIPDDFASCVKKMSDDMTSPTAINFSLTMRECGLQSTSCSSLRSCATHGANAEACNGRGKQGVVSFCDVDGRALTCWHDQMLSVRDCPRGGEQCLIVGGQASCTLGSCPAGFGEGDKARCSASATHLLRCEKGKLASLDCAAFGLRCSVGADGGAGCATTGAPCAAGTNRCDGNVAVGCINAHEVRVDCGAAGLTCNQTAGSGSPVGACVSPPPPTGACDPSDRSRCDDGNVKYCFGGKPRTYSCKAAGFGRCENVKNGVHCAP